MQGVHRERAARFLAPARVADSQPAKQGGRNKRVSRKPPGDRFRKLTGLNAIGRQCIVTGNRTTAVHHDKRCGDFSSGILAGLMMDVTVEFRNARVESGPVVSRAEGLYPVLNTRRGSRERLAAGPGRGRAGSE